MRFRARIGLTTPGFTISYLSLSLSRRDFPRTARYAAIYKVYTTRLGSRRIEFRSSHVLSDSYCSIRIHIRPRMLSRNAIYCERGTLRSDGKGFCKFNPSRDAEDLLSLSSTSFSSLLYHSLSLSFCRGLFIVRARKKRHVHGTFARRS